MTQLCVLLLIALLSSCSARVWRLTERPPSDWLIAPDRTGEPSADSHAALYGNYERDAYVDLRPGMRLKVVSPVTEGNAPLRTEAVIPDTPGAISVKTNVTGFRVDYYTVQPKGKGVSIPPPLAIPAHLPHVRLFYQRRISLDDHPITLLAASKPEAMRNAVCGQPEEKACIETGAGVAITAEIPVRINGKDTFVRLGASVGEVLREANVDRTAASRRLRFWRNHKGRRVPVQFDPNGTAILRLRLNEHDTLQW